MKKYTFPVPGCGQCPHHQKVGNIISETRYCAGFKGRKPKRFRKSDPMSKAPKWCPKRIDPPVCRIYGFKDERSEFMDFLWRWKRQSGRKETVSPHPSHYAPRAEIPLGMTAKQLCAASQEGPLDGILPEKVGIGEIIEIDDGLKSYYFYVLDFATIVPVPYFHLSTT